MAARPAQKQAKYALKTAVRTNVCILAGRMAEAVFKPAAIMHALILNSCSICPTGRLQRLLFLDIIARLIL